MDAPSTIALPAGISIRPIDTAAQTFDAHDVLSRVWGGDGSGMPPNLLRALAHAGNYAHGLYDGEAMVGASVAFFAAPETRSIHSHITGILAEYRGRHLGLAFKQHQRAWALARRITHITWTFDPLVARNAHFNLRRLGAHVTQYLVNHYGDMDDGINRGDESDRMLVDWDLTGPAAMPPAGIDVVAAVAVPRDIESLRKASLVDAAAWRHRVREGVLAQLAAGHRVATFDDARGYLFTAE